MSRSSHHLQIPLRLVPWLVLVALGVALALTATSILPPALGILSLLSLLGLVTLDILLLPEPRLPQFLVGATIVGMGLAVATWPPVAALFDIGRFVAPLLLILLVFHVRRRRLPAATTPRQRLFAGVLFAVIGVSTILSVDRKTTLTKFLALGIVVLAIAAACRWADSHGTSLRGPVLAALSVLVASNLAALFFGVGTFTLDRYRGWTINANSLGVMCGLALPLLGAEALRRSGRGRNWSLAAILVAGTLLLLTGSRSSLLGAVLGLLVVLRAGKLTRSVIFPVLLFGVLIVAPLAFRAVDQTELLRPVERTGESGREEVWPVALDQMLERPLFGAGFSTTEDRFLTGEFGTFDTFQGGQFHNSYLEAGAEMGVPGFLLLLVAGAVAWSYLFRPVPLSLAWAAGLVVAAASIGIFETGLLTPGSVLFFPFWLGLAVLTRARVLQRRATSTGSLRPQSRTALSR